MIQYSVKHENKLDCGGAYIKLLPGGDKFESTKFGGDTPYAVMFGPDICGSSNKRTHVIFHYEKKSDNLLVKKNINCEDDTLSHLYTLVLRPDNTFEVFVDNKSVRSGKLEEEFDFLPAKERLRTRTNQSQPIGSMIRKFPIRTMSSLRGMMMYPRNFPIRMPRNQMIGMMRMMVNGRHRWWTILTTRDHGSRK